MSYRNSVPFNAYIKTDAVEYSPLINALRDRLNCQESFKSWRSIHDKHLLLILHNLHLAYQMSPDTYVAYSRNKNDYSTEEARKAPFKLSYGATIRIVDGLTALEMIEGTKGIYYDDKDDPDNPLLAFVARMRATLALVEAFPEADVAPLRLVPREKELIVLHDEKKQSIPFTDNDEISRMRENVGIINAMNQDHFVALCVLDEEFENIFRRMNSDRYGGRATSDMYFGHSSVRRIFCNSTFEDGGRFYGGWWENLPKEYRKYIRIDNKMVVELDYSCLHPTLLYLEDGIAVPEGDMYDVPGFPPEARSYLKKSMNIILNAKGETSAIKAIRSEQRKDASYPPLPEGMTIKEILGGFKHKHEAISRHFYTTAGRRLQRIDSDIAEAVMLELVAQGIPVLPLHDSFLVSRIHKDELETIMNGIVSKRYGIPIKVKADETAWDTIFDIGLEDEYSHDIDTYEREAINHYPLFTIYNRQLQRHNNTYPTPLTSNPRAVSYP
jgi:hypothetical protein